MVQVRVRPEPATSRLLRRQARVARGVARIHRVRAHRGRLRRPRPDDDAEPADTHVLRQDRRPHALSDGAQSRGDEDLGRRDLHRRRGLPAVLVADTRRTREYVALLHGAVRHAVRRGASRRTNQTH